MDLPRRKRIRLQGYDYSQNGAYFVTICTQKRECLLGDVICAVKSISTKTANKSDGITGRKIWQFRFHDHIIRNEKSYREIWQYIDANPLKWQEDYFYNK